MVYIVACYTGIITVFAGSGKADSVDGIGTVASFYYPRGLAIDQQTGNIFVSDSEGHVIRKITPQGLILILLFINSLV
jgi:hypothetical protein